MVIRLIKIKTGGVRILNTKNLFKNLVDINRISGNVDCLLQEVEGIVCAYAPIMEKIDK